MKDTITSLGGRAPPGRNRPPPYAGSRSLASAHGPLARDPSAALAPPSSAPADLPRHAPPAEPRENGDELFNVIDDPEERQNVASDYPAVVAERRAEVEGLLGQPLPGHLVEVCDPAPGPMTRWLSQKLRDF